MTAERWALVGRRLPLAMGAAALAASAVPAGLKAQAELRDPEGLFTEPAVSTLFEGGFFTEGPAMGPDGLLYFSDITFSTASGMQAGHIWQLDPVSGEARIFRSPSGMSNGLLFDHQGRLLAALGADFGGRAVIRTEMDTGRSTILAGLFDGRSFNSPNDLALDDAGRIYFTDPRYTGHEPLEQGVMGVYRIDPDGSVHRLATDAGMPNGIAVSPDQGTLYVASAQGVGEGFNGIQTFDLDADGEISARRVLVEFPDDGGVDGMAVDEAGHVYAARPSAIPGVYVYAPDGEEVAFLPTPSSPSNVAFGTGRYATTLFITGGTSVFRIGTRYGGHQPGGS